MTANKSSSLEDRSSSSPMIMEKSLERELSVSQAGLAWNGAIEGQ
jgi:hypothetical protein